jgi:hypothetical protein
MTNVFQSAPSSAEQAAQPMPPQPARNPNFSSSEKPAKARETRKNVLHTFAFQRISFIQHSYYQQFE